MSESIHCDQCDNTRPVYNINWFSCERGLVAQVYGSNHWFRLDFCSERCAAKWFSARAESDMRDAVEEFTA